ncbi:site-specific tyrosine recombinase XerC [Xenorhabdus bovienii]|uniref:site-specific tyrosine recombinase XerC n=3 Tax=Xenorhabdus bovienii TaxID=40576 RepID=UPI0023B2BC77|nr:site-specific tyrosine recombinase XerC [Xenorhabdus bovienii]
MKTHEMCPPDTLRQHLAGYLDTLRARGYTLRTLSNTRGQLRPFIDWCEQRGVTHAPQVSLALLESWQRDLRTGHRADGQPYSHNGQIQRLGSLKRWFIWLLNRHHILANPAEALILPRTAKRLPVQLLNEHDVAQVLGSLDSGTPTDFRNRVMLEVLWSTGIRRSELRHLRPGDIDRERGTLAVRQGKGRKDRVVPIGERALDWLARYQQTVRPQLLRRHDSGYLFVTQQGQPLSLARLTEIAGRTLRERAGLDKPGACHVFRHSMATAMLDNGADIRHIQSMLGHEQLSTTQIYTQVAIGHLKKVHQQTHPAERDGKTESGPAQAETAAQGSDGDRTGQPDHPG